MTISNNLKVSRQALRDAGLEWGTPFAFHELLTSKDPGDLSTIHWRMAAEIERLEDYFCNDLKAIKQYIWPLDAFVQKTLVPALEALQKEPRNLVLRAKVERIYRHEYQPRAAYVAKALGLL